MNGKFLKTLHNTLENCINELDTIERTISNEDTCDT